MFVRIAFKEHKNRWLENHNSLRLKYLKLKLDDDDHIRNRRD